jgi:hypothetical protein
VEIHGGIVSEAADIITRLRDPAPLMILPPGRVPLERTASELGRLSESMGTFWLIRDEQMQ